MPLQRRLLTLMGFGCSAALVAAGALLVASASPAAAGQISGGVLQLVAVPGALSDNSMAPGKTLYWPITADLNAPTSGQLSLQISSTEALATNPQGLRVSLAGCPVAWTTFSDPTIAPTCRGGAGTVMVPDSAFANIAPTETWQLATVPAVSTTSMLATISLPPTVPSVLQGASASIDFAFTALGDTQHVTPTDPTGPLAITGLNPAGPLLLAIGLLLGGFTLARTRSAVLRRDAITQAGASK
jgi:hypothetical protein